MSLDPVADSAPADPASATPDPQPAAPPDPLVNPPADPVASTGTLGEGGGGADQAVAAPAAFPDNWRDIMAGGDDKFLARLNRFTSPATFGKSWLASQQKITSGEMIKAKPDDTDEAALNEWRAQAGIPEQAEKYLDGLPDGLIVGEDDKEDVGAFLKAMHEGDAPPALVHKALAWYYDSQEQKVVERTEADKQYRVESEDSLRGEWGPEFRPNMNGIAGMFAAHGGDGLMAKLYSSRTADGTLVGDDPDTLRFLAAVSRIINPPDTVTPILGQTQLQTIKTEIAQLETEMADTKGLKFDYYTNDAKQARYRQLIDMRDQHKGSG